MAEWFFSIYWPHFVALENIIGLGMLLSPAMLSYREWIDHEKYRELCRERLNL